MLYEFMLEHRDTILRICTETTRSIGNEKPISLELERGMPLFYQEVIDVLKRESCKKSNSNDQVSTDEISDQEAAAHGKESLRLGYSISQVVHGYGALCQAITETAHKYNTNISTREFHQLNKCLDVAIAEAVTEYALVNKNNLILDKNEHQENLIEELKNTLTAALMAHQVIKKGVVGIGGSTGRILDKSLSQMRDLIDHYLSETRIRPGYVTEKRRQKVVDMISKVEATTAVDANLRGLILKFELEPELEVNGDHRLIESALTNLVDNAIRSTKHAGTVWVRSRGHDGHSLIEVEDQSGGLPEGGMEELFSAWSPDNSSPYYRDSRLRISRRAIAMSGGQLTGRNIPGKGCVFTIDLPPG